MKKKFKLFATIGSLALAVCMMTIGVLAATSVSLTVNSTVSFSSTSVYVTFVGTVSGGDSINKTVTAKNYTELTAQSNGTFTAQAGGDSANFTGGAWNIGSLAFAEGAGQTIKYVFKFTNDTPEKAIDIVVTPTNAAGETVDAVISYQTEDGAGTASDLEGLASGKYVEYVYTLTLNNVSQTLDASNVSFDIDITPAA